MKKYRLTFNNKSGLTCSHCGNIIKTKNGYMKKVGGSEIICFRCLDKIRKESV